MRLHRLIYLTAFTILVVHGATISTDVSCGGTLSQNQPGGAGIANASCAGFDPNFVTFYSSAGATVSVTGTLVGLTAHADSFHLASSASASYSTILSLTVSGGTGTGFLIPTNSVGDPGLGIFGSVGGSFEGAAPAPPGAPCFSFVPPNGPPLPGCSTFTFGQTNLYTLNMSVSASNNANAFAHFADGFQFWDAQGNPLSNVQYTLTGLANVPADAPEPDGRSLVLLGLALAGVIRIRTIKWANSGNFPVQPR